MGCLDEHGCVAEVDYRVGYPATVNSEQHTEYAIDAAKAVSAQVIENCDPIMAGEDFSFMLNERPGAYIMIGNGDGPLVHHPEYHFDDEAIPAGASWFAEIVERRMPAE